jgi:hypothetical protein
VKRKVTNESAYDRISLITRFLKVCERTKRIRRLDISGKKLIDPEPDFLGFPGVYPIEAVSARNILEDLIFKFLSGSFQCLDQNE